MKVSNYFKGQVILTSVAQLGVILESKWSPVRFLVRAHAWVAGSSPQQECTRGNQLMFLSCINVTLALFLPPSPLYKVHKIFLKIIKNKTKRQENYPTIRLLKGNIQSK